MKYEDLSEAQRVLWSIDLADHLGDVADIIPRLCRLLGVEPPEWSDEKERYAYPWEPLWDDE
jgi:hypothetical protein